MLSENKDGAGQSFVSSDYNLMDHTKMKCCYCPTKYISSVFFHVVIVNVMYFLELNCNDFHVLFVNDARKHNVIVTLRLNNFKGLMETGAVEQLSSLCGYMKYCSLPVPFNSSVEHVLINKTFTKLQLMNF